MAVLAFLLVFFVMKSAVGKNKYIRTNYSFNNSNLKHTDLVFTSSDFKANASYVGNFSFCVFNTSEGKSRLNLTMTQLVNFQKMSIKLSFDWTNAGKKTYSLNIDICKMSRGTMGGLFVIMLHESLLRSSNIKFSCPQPKNFYYISNFIPIDKKLMPMVFFGFQGAFKITALMKVKTSSSKPFIGIFSLIIHGYA